MAKNKNDELVLCVSEHLLYALGNFKYLQEKDSLRYLDIFLTPGNCIYLPRGYVEYNPTFKQLIPYILLVNEGSKRQYLTYERVGSEARLHKMYSIGVGGHVSVGSVPIRSTLDQQWEDSIYRELHEEIGYNIERKVNLVPYGMVHDESTMVGKVHIGVVYRLSISPEIVKSSSEVTSHSWKTVNELCEIEDNLEVWAKMCLDHLKKEEMFGR